MKAENLDNKFDTGASVWEHFDKPRINKPELKLKCVNVDFCTAEAKIVLMTC